MWGLMPSHLFVTAIAVVLVMFGGGFIARLGILARNKPARRSAKGRS